MLGLGDRRPETVTAADRAITAIRRLREIEVGLECHRPAMATAVVGFEHRAFLVKGK